jgi:L-lysine 6-oxidase
MAQGKSTFTYKVEPSIGLARVGDSTTEFYLAPETIGGRPIECDSFGNATIVNGKPAPVERYKDPVMRVKRQGAKFRIMRYDSANQGTEVTLDDADVVSIEWRVHVANKKAAWYSFSELLGNLYYSGVYTPQNSYQNKNVELRNPGVTDSAARKNLIIDPGPRTISGRQQQVLFSRGTIPDDYPHGHFPVYGPDGPLQGYPIETLGSAVTDDAGRLVVIGAYGRAGGDEPISSYGGANSWHDDIADGPVTCRLTTSSGVIELDAWVIVGSPKFAPELVNITTLDDLLYDVGVRYHNLVPAMYSNGRFDTAYMASYETDIRPILERMAAYQWVSNVQAMTAAATPGFDLRDPSDANRVRRQSLFAQFRNLDNTQALWAANGAPAMPLNSGTNSVSNEQIVKFSTLTATQFFLLGQWAEGRFAPGARPATPGVSALDRADVGNATGEPMSPGIEVTWSMRNPTLYDRAYHIKHRTGVDYRATGLDPAWNETVPMPPETTSVVGFGCEPGDLTKRMAIPWQADFFQCTLQYVNFTDPNVNKVNGIPKPPTYYAYWWPPQSPWDVISGADEVDEQTATGVPAGVQLNYARGINSFVDMITGWKYLGFIHNQTLGDHRQWYPYFVEVERNNGRFAMASVAIGGISNVVDPTNVTFTPTWFLRDENDAAGQQRAKALRAALAPGAPALDEDEVLPKPITAHPNLGLPRNGRVIR